MMVGNRNRSCYVGYRVFLLLGTVLLFTSNTMMVSVVQAASICGVEFNPCNVAASSPIEECCPGLTCLLTTDFVPPISNVDYIWPGRCLSERSMQLNLLAEDYKKYMIYSIYNWKAVYSTKDWKTVEDREYMVNAFVEIGQFAQLVYALERKFKIDIPIPDSLPENPEEGVPIEL
jgi:hypothetical protein